MLSWIPVGLWTVSVVNSCMVAWDHTGRGELITIEDPSLSTHGYQLLSLATSQLVGKNRESDVSGIFSPVLLFVGGGELMAFEDLLLSAHIYQLLPLATIQLVGNNREFDVSGIFWGGLLIVGGGDLITTEDLLLSTIVTNCYP